MQRARVSVLAVLAVGVLATPAPASTYQVSPDGDDGNDGSAAAPWRSLQRAADAVAPGDTVLIAAGDYAGMQLETSGTEAAPIVFQAAAGVAVTSDNATTPDGINLEGASWVTIDGFTVDGRTRAGIRAVTCAHVTLRHNHTDGNGRWGIFTGFCDDLLIERNQASRSTAEHGIYVSNSGDRPVVRDNVLWGNHGSGLHVNGDASSGGDGVISDALIEANVVFGNGAGGGSGINCDGVVDATIRNNLVYDNLSAGLSLYQIDGGAPSTGNLVINNTIAMPAGAGWGINIQDGSTANTLRNNIVVSADDIRGAFDLCDGCQDALVSDHNVLTGRIGIADTIFTLADWVTMTGQDADAIEATAAELFTDAATGDYTLLDGAPAIDAGSPVGAPDSDLAGTARPVGAGIDIGAYERCVGDACAPPVCTSLDCVDGGAAAGGGCCQSGGGGSGGALLLVALVGAALRRRATCLAS